MPTQISEVLLSEIRAFIDANYVEPSFGVLGCPPEEKALPDDILADMCVYGAMPSMAPTKPAPRAKKSRQIVAVPQKKESEKTPLEIAIEQIDESFSEMLLRKISESGLNDAQVYKKAGIDRKLFSKIRSDKHYRPSKPTVISFAIALELSLDETKDMLMKAGFALSHSSKFDIIIEYFISRGNYNFSEINAALYAFDQSLLGM